MTRAIIPGVLNLAAYELLAGKHRPRDDSALHAEIRRLHGDGMSIESIATAFRVSGDAVRAVLSQSQAKA
jgi:DNA invertase Pin-like site-specific DNA recombinase